MSDPNYPIEWRPGGSLRKRRFYAKYLKLLMRLGYLFVLTALGGLLVAFIVQTDRVIATIPDDLGTLTGRRTIITADEPAMIMEVFVSNGGDVVEGDPLLSVAEGDELALALARLQLESLGTPAALRALQEMPTVNARIVTAPQAGEVRVNQGGSLIAEGQEIARVTDYSEIVVISRLRGDSIALARSGQTARVSQITPGRIGDTLTRISFEGETATSGSILDQEIRKALEPTIAGRQWSVRNDLTFEAKGLGAIEVEVRAKVNEAPPEVPGALLEPLRGRVFEADLESGRHFVLLQTTDVSAEQRSLALTKVRERLEGAAVATFDGVVERSVVLSRLDEQLNLVLQIRAEVDADSATEAEEGDRVSTIDRYFDAVLVIPQPSGALVQLIRETERDGREVRGRVELITGQRPFALQLLRR